ncbi:exodeoxyribonuclease V subunit alpha [Tessaracoccus sp. MC1865]|uniref:exodeoxyribonuclease V subunit alpha n=1 Tax=Tessaracoccus sp. MC1865 TaxID=2760310 RepID=UPI0016021F45|nr:exodeoxyribonuclease V subunit alpha [Tessaracoccus sp. MC1865]MBB1484930.1 exodeoxyribonuclease V subunit alpha [Tessaracoccus sp. MC1865]QTO38637.1 exodeoxyribonuclease V subunit alpha [Tessaracoccus sp. MC1865]
MREVPVAATGLLRTFCEAGWLGLIDFHLAKRLGALSGEAEPQVLLAFALAARELRLGSVCLDLATAATDLRPESDDDSDGDTEEAVALPWPDHEHWLESVACSAAVADAEGEENRPFRLDGTLLYLDRYWRQERKLEQILQRRSSQPALASHSEAPIPLPRPDGTEQEADVHQNAAVLAALNHGTTVITGGPGTGKTTIVSRILHALAPQSPRIALVAPTGKAAARLQQAVREQGQGHGRLWGGTIHKLLGARPRTSQMEFNAQNPVPYDLVVVDETSMVSLELMTSLLEAVAPTTRLVMLGDPHQLRSVEAGAVLADIERAPDLVTAPGGAIVRLVHNYRSRADINELAEAILTGDSARARHLVEESESLRFVEFSGSADPATLTEVRHDALATATLVQAAARKGEGTVANRALERHRILCGHREGPFGVSHWARSVRTWLATQLEEYGFDSRPYVGQPLLIQRNTDLFSNGDTAVVVQDDGGLVAVVDLPEAALRVAPSLLDDAADLHAMTIHKSQGSQFAEVSVVLPPPGSPLLTRELLYTAVTRAQERVTLYGSWEALATAVETPARRASGLARTTG